MKITITSRRLFLLSILAIHLLSVIFFFKSASATPNVIVVPDGFESIQAGILAAKDGDTIIVKAGVYHECLVIDKSLTLIGEHGAIIQGNGKGHTVEITAYRVTLIGFTINGSCKSPWSGIYIHSTCTNITGNIIMNHYCGIRIYDSSYTFLRNNSITSNRFNLWVWGLYLQHFIHDIDSSNTVNGKPVCYWINKQNEQVPSDAGYVAVINSSNIAVRGLTLTDNGEGILLRIQKTLL